MGERNKNILIGQVKTMRRKDREMTKEFGLEVIDKSKYGIIYLEDGSERIAFEKSL